MDAEKHLQEKERLNRALDRKFSEAVSDLEGVMKKYNLEARPGIAFDLFRHTIEVQHMKRFNLPE